MRRTDLGFVPRVLACFSPVLDFVLAILREIVLLGNGAFRPIRFTIKKPDIVPATTPARNSMMVISKLTSPNSEVRRCRSVVRTHHKLLSHEGSVVDCQP